ncbi:MAG: hypothetical protein ACRDBO_12370 [Lachnospiraceae bacterium]
MNLRKKITTLAVAAAMAAMSVIPAFAAVVDGYQVDMYGYVADKYEEDGYVLSDHASAMVSSVSVNSDGDYVVVFNATSSGYISAISTAAGEEGELDEDNNITLVFAPEEVSFTTLEIESGVLVDSSEATGTLIEYTVILTSGRHSTSEGALYIELAPSDN